MTTALTALTECAYNNRLVRMFGTKLEPWFALTDICEILELGNPSRVANRLDDDEKGITISNTLGGPQEILIVSEPGFYTVVFQSRKPEAKLFRRWVTHEVLPSIRKHGYYKAPKPPKLPKGKVGRPALTPMQELEREQKCVLANGERCTEGDIFFYCESLGAPDELFKGKKSLAAEVLKKWLDEKMQELGVSSKSELWHFYRTEYVD